MIQPRRTALIHPRPGVSAAIFRDDAVLLVQRAKPPFRGLWSLPGGHIEAGERAIDAAHRELEEETGVAAGIYGVAGIHDIIRRDENGLLLAHYVLIVYYGAWRAGEARPGGDAAAVRWISPSAIAGLPATEGAAEYVGKARLRLREHG